MKVREISLDRQGLWIIIIIELFILINAPCVLNRFIPLPDLQINGLFMFFLFLVIFVNDSAKKHILLLPPKITNLAIITSIAWLVFFVYHDFDLSYLTRVFLVWLTYFVLAVLYERKLFYKFWFINNRWILIQTGLGLVCIIFVAVGLLGPIATAYDLGIIHRPTYFFGISFSNSYTGNIVRPAGVFDEPGALAFWAIFALMIDLCFIKDRIVQRYMPIFTFCTLSMAYTIQIAAYAVMRNITKPLKIALLFVFATIAISYIETTENSDVDLYYYTLRRFQISDERGLEGNNRKEQMDNALETFSEHPFFGIGGQKASDRANSADYYRITDNPYEILAKDGIIGYFITYLPIFLILFSKDVRRKEVLIAIFVLLIGYLQRPFHLNFVHFFYLWGFYLMILQQRKEGVGKKVGTFNI